MSKSTPLEVADALRAMADKAASYIEHLDTENETMRRASSGILPDGTPVEDMLEDLKETKAREASLRHLLRSIQYQTTCKASEASKAIKAIRELIANAD